MASRADAFSSGLDFSPPHRLPKILRSTSEPVLPQSPDMAVGGSATAYDDHSPAERGALTSNYAGVALAVLIAIPLGIAAMFVFGDAPGP